MKRENPIDVLDMIIKILQGYEKKIDEQIKKIDLALDQMEKVLKIQ